MVDVSRSLDHPVSLLGHGSVGDISSVAGGVTSTEVELPSVLFAEVEGEDVLRDDALLEEGVEEGLLSDVGDDLISHSCRTRTERKQVEAAKSATARAPMDLANLPRTPSPGSSVKLAETVVAEAKSAEEGETVRPSLLLPCSPIAAPTHVASPPRDQRR